MQHSSVEMLGIVAELNVRRIPMVMGARVKRLGGVATLRPDEEQNLVKVREIHQRYMQGRYQHTDRELKQVKAVCDFLVIEHATCNNQDPRLDYGWDEGRMTSREPLCAGPKQQYINGTVVTCSPYEEAMMRCTQEW